MTMDLPAPVSPVSALKPGRNWMSASWISAMFSMCRSSSMGSSSEKAPGGSAGRGKVS